jgi:hypothetical protein
MGIVFRERLLLVGVVVVAAQVVSWFVFSSRSPLDDYFLWNPAIRNGWALLNLPGSYVGILVSGNLHQPSPLGEMFGRGLQWAGLASVVSLVLPTRRSTEPS